MTVKAIVISLGRRKADGKPYAKVMNWSDKANGFCNTKQSDGTYGPGFVWLTDDKYDELKLSIKDGAIIEYDRPENPAPVVE